jgi:hypothetical protein
MGMILPWRGLVVKEVFMRLACRSLMVSFVALFFVQGTCLQAVELQLHVPSYEQCLEKSQVLGNKLTCAKYLRAAALTVSTLVAIYTIYDFFWGETPKKDATILPIEEKHPWFSLKTAKNIGCWLAKGCAYTICTQWIAHKLMTNRGEPKHFIPQHLYGYKNHGTEIERLLLLRTENGDCSSSANPSDFANLPSDKTATADRADIDILIQAHLQQLINKTEILMAYMIYWSAETLENALHVDLYAQEVLKKVSNAAAHFNVTYTENFDVAANECKDIYIEQLTSAIRYARINLPRD